VLKQLMMNGLKRSRRIWQSPDNLDCVQILRTDSQARYAQTANREGESAGMCRRGTVVNIETLCAHLRESAPATSARSRNAARGFLEYSERILGSAEILRAR
jgi:hypothetical protein